MPPPNNQVGTQFVRKSAPKFDGYRIKRGTYKPENQTQMETVEDEDTGRVINHSFWGGDVRATCEMYQLAGSPDIVEGQVLPDVDGNGWVVEKANAITFGPGAARFAVTIFFGEDEDTSQVS